MKKTINRIIVIGVLALIIGLLFYKVYAILNLREYIWQDCVFFERALYVILAVLAGAIYKFIYDILKKLPAKIAVSLGIALTYTIGVFFANNYFHFLYENAFWGGWRFPVVPYSYFLKYDLNYDIGYGEYRYLLTFVLMSLANLVTIIYFQKISPVIKKWLQKIGLWYFGPDESTIEYRIHRLLTGADYDDFINEINCMPMDAENKDLFKKLINKYDGECKIIELYQALFVRYGKFLSREEYFEYRQKYLDQFEDPLPDECVSLDEIHNYNEYIGSDCDTSSPS